MWWCSSPWFRLPEVAQLGGGLTPAEVRILPPPLVYPRLKPSQGLLRVAERGSFPFAISGRTAKNFDRARHVVVLSRRNKTGAWRVSEKTFSRQFVNRGARI